MKHRGVAIQALDLWKITTAKVHVALRGQIRLPEGNEDWWFVSWSDDVVVPTFTMAASYKKFGVSIEEPAKFDPAVREAAVWRQPAHVTVGTYTGLDRLLDINGLTEMFEDMERGDYCFETERVEIVEAVMRWAGIDREIEEIEIPEDAHPGFWRRGWIRKGAEGNHG